MWVFDPFTGTLKFVPMVPESTTGQVNGTLDFGNVTSDISLDTGTWDPNAGTIDSGDRII